MKIKIEFLLPVLIVTFNLLLAGIAPAQTFSNLYSFTGAADGGTVYAGLTRGSDGNFYGTTEYGGVSRCPRHHNSTSRFPRQMSLYPGRPTTPRTRSRCNPARISFHRRRSGAMVLPARVS
jgi:hypothetical protein